MKMRADFSYLLGKHVKVKLACGMGEESNLEGDVIQIIEYQGEDAAILYDANYQTQLIAIKEAKITVLGSAYIFDCCGFDLESDEKRIEKMTSRLQTVWKQKPSLRMGQLLCELLRLTKGDGYYVSDLRMNNYMDQLEDILLKEKK